MMFNAKKNLVFESFDLTQLCNTKLLNNYKKNCLCGLVLNHYYQNKKKIKERLKFSFLHKSTVFFNDFS